MVITRAWGGQVRGRWPKATNVPSMMRELWGSSSRSETDQWKLPREQTLEVLPTKREEQLCDVTLRWESFGECERLRSAPRAPPMSLCVNCVSVEAGGGWVVLVNLVKSRGKYKDFASSKIKILRLPISYF